MGSLTASETGALVLATCQKCDWTIDDLAEHLGVSAGYLKDAASAEHRIENPQTVEDLRQLLNDGRPEDWQPASAETRARIDRAFERGMDERMPLR